MRTLITLKQHTFSEAEMEQTIHATYNGAVLVPENGVQLVAGKRYELTLRALDEKKPATLVESAWDVLKRATGTAEGPQDWASELDHYLYGAPKRNQPNA